MSDMSFAEKQKIHISEVREFLQHVFDNPDHKIRVEDMYSRDEALIKKEDIPQLKIYDDPEDDYCCKFLDYNDVLKALGLIEMEN